MGHDCACLNIDCINWVFKQTNKQTKKSFKWLRDMSVTCQARKVKLCKRDVTSGANVKWESGARLSYSWGEERRISLRIRLFDALMKCWNLAKRDRYNSSRLIVLDAYLCQPSVRCTRVGPKNTHANHANSRAFYLFATTVKRRRRRWSRSRRKKHQKKKKKKKTLAGRTTKGGDSARRMAGCGSEPGGGGKSP